MSRFKRLDYAVHRAKLPLWMVVDSVTECSCGTHVRCAYYNERDGGIHHFEDREDMFLTTDEARMLLEKVINDTRKPPGFDF